MTTDFSATELDELDRVANAAQAQWNEWPAPKRTAYIRTLTPAIALRLIAMARQTLQPAAPSSPEQDG